MTSPSKKNQKLARNLGISYARLFYRDFTTHPGYMGPMWKWEEFPEFAKRNSECSCFMRFTHGVRGLPKLEQICGRAAKKEAKKLMKDGVWRQKQPPVSFI